MKNNNPTISIIMPVFNEEKYLHKAIESILYQSFTDFELLIIDDFSTDTTIKIIKEYIQKESKIKLLINKNNKGLVGALNTGLEYAIGKYIARADGDDVNRFNRLQNQYEYLEKYPDVYILGGGYHTFNEFGKIKEIYHPTSSFDLAWQFLSNTYFAHPSVLFRKEIIKNIGLYKDMEAEDFDYFSRIIRKYKGANIKEILIEYREHNTNRSFKFEKEIYDSVKKTFYENYKFYMCDDKYADKFYEFHRLKNIRLKYLPILVFISLKILNKIRINHNLSIFNLRFISYPFKLIKDYTIIYFKRISIKLIKIINQQKINYINSNIMG